MSAAEWPRIRAQYEKLAAYCSAFWNTVTDALPGQIACRKGCAICCELPSVNLLEARLIADYCVQHPVDSPARDPAKRRDGNQDGSCPFCDDNACRIYEVRPIICRTHGLLLRGESFREPITISCPYNFRDLDLAAIDTTLVLDIETVSDNLARLNAAFCLAQGDVKKASERVLLKRLSEGSVKAPFLSR